MQEFITQNTPQILSFAFCILAIGAGIVLFFVKGDKEHGLKMEARGVILAVLYSLGGGIAVCMGSNWMEQLQIMLLLAILLSEGFVDLQTGMVYVVQTIALGLTQAGMVLIRYLAGKLDITCAMQAGWLEGLLPGLPQAPITGIVCVMIPIVLLASVKRCGIARGDAAIFAICALSFWSFGDGGTRMFVAVMAAYAVFVVSYLVTVIYKAVKYKENVLNIRCPFTAPIAFGALCALLIGTGGLLYA